MRDDLHRAAAVHAFPFLLQHGPVDLAGGHVGAAVQVFVDEALVMAEVQVRLGAVVGHEDLAVLHRVHGPRVNIDVGVEFLHGDLVSPGFQKPSEGCRGNPFSETRHHTACDKNVFYRHPLPPG